LADQPPPPPLAVELSRSVLRDCRRDPELTRAINAVLLRAARRLRSLMEDGRSVRVAGRVEGIVLEVRLLPPDGCRVEAVQEQAAADRPDLTV
jgi:hypothetical protein